MVVYLLIFWQMSTFGFQGPRYMATSYPRLLDAHIRLGTTLKAIAARDGIASFAFGDAGAAAYESGLASLDYVGLASSAVAIKGLTPMLLDKYDPGVVILYTENHSIRLQEFGQKRILDWMQAKDLLPQCEMYWRPDYSYWIFAKKAAEEFQSLCRDSKNANDTSDADYFNRIIVVPPWRYWHT